MPTPPGRQVEPDLPRRAKLLILSFATVALTFLDGRPDTCRPPPACSRKLGGIVLVVLAAALLVTVCWASGGLGLAPLY